MSNLKLCQKRSTVCLFIAAIVVVLLSHFVVATSGGVYAAPLPDIARIVHVDNTSANANSKITVYPADGGNPTAPSAVAYTEPGSRSNRLNKKPAYLGVPGNGSTAKLDFYRNGKFMGLVASIGSVSTWTTYSYPCSYGVGNVSVGWDISVNGDNFCPDIQIVNSGSARNLALSQQITQAARSKLIVSPQEELTLIHTYDNNGNLVVDVLLGAIRVTSASNPTGIVVAAGNQYIEPPNGRSRVQPIDIDRAVQSPSVQDFFKLDEWSSDRPAAELVRKFQESLQREPPPQ
jgi:hypothetical protein